MSGVIAGLFTVSAIWALVTTFVCGEKAQKQPHRSYVGVGILFGVMAFIFAFAAGYIARGEL